MSYPIDLSGQVAVVTGGAKGIGEATVNYLARAGAQVVIDDLAPEEKVQPQLDAVEKIGLRPFYLREDISKEK